MKSQLNASKLNNKDVSLSVIIGENEESDQSKVMNSSYFKISPRNRVDVQELNLNQRTSGSQCANQKYITSLQKSTNNNKTQDGSATTIPALNNHDAKKSESETNSSNDSSDIQILATTSLLIFKLDNPFRVFMIKVMTNIWFDRIILIVILANCVFLAIDDPNADNLPYQDLSDMIFQVIYTVEMIIKIIALGFVLEQNTYMRNGWNAMDFVVVIMGWISKFFSSSNVSALRVIRILRPLRTITSIPSMRRLVNSLLRSMPTMIDFFILFLFFLIIFGTAATQLFGGVLNQRCVDSLGVIQTDQYGNELFCNDSVFCPQEFKCVDNENPDYGVTSFDNMAVSCLNIFIIITLEGWTDIMYKIRRATGTFANDVYFFIVVIIGSFFIINLMIAVQFSYLSVAFKENGGIQQKESTKKKTVEEIEKEINFFSSNNSAEHDENDQNFTDFVDTQGNLQRKRKGYCSWYYKHIQNNLKNLVNSRFFNIIVMLLILVNTFLMALQHYNMSDILSNISNIGNSILTILFSVEMVLKVIGLGPKQYLMDGFNVFDAIIVIIGILEFANVGSKDITVFRTFRLLRIFKLVRSWHNLRKLLQTVLKSIKSMANLAFLMLILIFVYSLMGMQLLSGQVPVRTNFNSFVDSVITVFILLTAENWNAVLQAFIQTNGWTTVIYFVSLIVFGNIMLLNLFLAILLNFISENLEEEREAAKNALEAEQQKIKEQEDLEKISNLIPDNSPLENNQKVSYSFEVNLEMYNSQKLAKMISPQFIKWSSARVKSKRYDRYHENDDQKTNELNQNAKAIGNESQTEPFQFLDSAKRHSENESIKMQNQMGLYKKYRTMTSHSNMTLEIKDIGNQESNVERRINTVKEVDEDQKNNKDNLQQQNHQPLQTGGSQVEKKNQSFKLKRKKSEYKLRGKSVFCIDKDSAIRIKIKWFLEHEYFEFLILNIICVNSLLLALDQPVVTDEYFQMTQTLMTNIISVIYIIEAILKITMLGFVFGKDTYLRNQWNLLDFIIVIITIFNWVVDYFSDFEIGFLRVLRAFRALRPLKMVSKNEGLKTVINSLIKSIPSLINVVLITLLFLLVFSILGVQLLQGAMSYCSNPLVYGKYLQNLDYRGTKDECFGYYADSDGNLQWMDWVTPFNNFDNVINAMITFFEVATLEGWPDTLFAAIDSQGEDLGPMKDARQYIAVMFIVFIFITTFFIMNLFISVVVDKFNDEIKKQDLVQGFSDQEKDWLKIQKIMANKKPKIMQVAPRNNKCRLFFFKMQQSQIFELFIIVIIILNIIVICIDYVNMTLDLSDALNNINIAFVVIFSFEVLIKMIGLGLKQYFRERWNIFDMIIVILSILTSTDTLFPFKVNSIRIIRVTRLLRMIKASKGLRNLLKALFLSLKSIVNVVEILSLIFFTFSVAGMDLFGSQTPGPQFNQLNDDANFSTFYLSFTTLFRAATGESWNGLMHDCYQVEGAISVIYWMLFQIVSKYMFLNIFVAVIFENFAEVDAAEKGDFNLPVKKNDIKQFINVWVLFCPDGSYYLKTSYFISFLKTLPPPLGHMGVDMPIQEFYKYLHKIGIKSHLIDGVAYVYFPEVLWKLFNHVVGPQRKELIQCYATKDIIKKLKYNYKNLPKNTTFKSLTKGDLQKHDFSVMHFIIAIKIYQRIKFVQSIKNMGKITTSSNLESNIKAQKEEYYRRRQLSRIRRRQMISSIIQQKKMVQQEHQTDQQIDFAPVIVEINKDSEKEIDWSSEQSLRVQGDDNRST